MADGKIHIPARKKQPATDKDNPVVKVSPGCRAAFTGSI